MAYSQPESTTASRSSSHHRNASSYISAEAASPAYEREAQTQLLDSPPRSPRSPISPSPISPGRYEGQMRSVSGTSQMSGGGALDEGFSVMGIGRAVVSRVVRSAKRGNLPFIVVFLSCVIIFFSALAGIGYVDPDSSSIVNTEVADFMPGIPVYDPNEASDLARRKRVEAQRELEKSWQKKKRPKDGAWMQKQRDDRAIRRVPLKPMEPAKVEIYEDLEARKEGAETIEETATATLVKRAFRDEEQVPVHAPEKAQETAQEKEPELEEPNDGLLVTRDPWEAVSIAEENQYDSAVRKPSGEEGGEDLEGTRQEEEGALAGVHI